VRNAIIQYNCKVILLDNLMTAMQDDTANDYYRQQSAFVRELATMARKFDVCIFLVAHPRKSNLNEFRNDDVSGSGNITNLASMVLQYGDTRDEGDPGDRILRVTKDRLTGYTNHKGIPLWFQESSKRISEVEGEFDWKYSWETDSADNGFSDLEDLDIPFGEDEDDE
jgi:RecA-family ATPase